MPEYIDKKSFGFTTFSLHERGFTLIELLVTISIIAVLATIGATIFTGTQNKARDSARKADIVAIAKAMESNYDPVTGTYITSKILDGTAFASGQIPIPPEGGSYFADLTADSKGFRTCATLSDSSAFCKDSEQGVYTENPPISPYLFGTPPGVPTATPGSPTDTPTPTLSGPTNTPTPTSPVPTATPTPTTPAPTATPTPTTPAPTPTPTTPAGGPQRMFTTSTGYNGNLGGLAGADQKCLDRANAANLCGGVCPAGSWKAWLSDTALSAANRLQNSTNQYVKLNGVVVANSWLDLIDGTIASAIDRNEFNVVVAAGNSTWTGTNSNGTSSANNCSNWTSSLTAGQAGSPTSTSVWTNSIPNGGCGANIRLYCIDVSNP